MNALPLMLGALCFLAIGYRYYSAFLATKVVVLDDSRITPAHELRDGHNYVPTGKWVLFGHHFAAITGAGPLIGPTLAAQFGFLPGFLWLLIGVVLGGAVHDFIILFSSVRRKGKSLAEIARQEIGPVAGTAAAVAILFIVVIALAGLGLAVVNALRDSAWGAFTIAVSIPLAMIMGVYTERIRTGGMREATVFGVAMLVAAVIFGRDIAESSFAGWFTFDKNQLTFLLAGYGFLASVLPAWLLLCPRDYLSSFMKIGTIGFLVAGVLIVNPVLRMPTVSEFAAGGGPIIPGKLFPFLFVTIACGAISGFHGLIASGTTPKMIDKESHIRPIAYGAMLFEGLVGVTTLIAASALYPADYFAINVEPARYATLAMAPVNLPELGAEVGESLAGRTGGAVSLATLMVVSAWGYFIYTGSISTLWPMFGIANQLLAAAALAVGTTVIINMGRARYAWVTLLPLCFVATTTMTAGWQSIWTIFLPRQDFQGYLNSALTVLMMICLLVVIGSAVRRWIRFRFRPSSPAALEAEPA